MKRDPSPAKREPPPARSTTTAATSASNVTGEMRRDSPGTTKIGSDGSTGYSSDFSEGPSRKDRRRRRLSRRSRNRRRIRLERLAETAETAETAEARADRFDSSAADSNPSLRSSRLDSNPFAAALASASADDRAALHDALLAMLRSGLPSSYDDASVLATYLGVRVGSESSVSGAPFEEAAATLAHALRVDEAFFEHATSADAKCGLPLAFTLLALAMRRRRDGDAGGFAQCACFALLRLSSSRNFGAALNARASPRWLPELELAELDGGTWRGTHADALVATTHALLTDGDASRTAPLISPLLTTLHNAAPHWKNLSSRASTRLVRLVERHARPETLFAQPDAYRDQLRELTGALSPIDRCLRHQPDENPRLVLAVLEAEPSSTRSTPRDAERCQPSTTETHTVTETETTRTTTCTTATIPPRAPRLRRRRRPRRLLPSRDRPRSGSAPSTPSYRWRRSDAFVDISRRRCPSGSGRDRAGRRTRRWSGWSLCRRAGRFRASSDRRRRRRCEGSPGGRARGATVVAGVRDGTGAAEAAVGRDGVRAALRRAARAAVPGGGGEERG